MSTWRNKSFDTQIVIEWRRHIAPISCILRISLVSGFVMYSGSYLRYDFCTISAMTFGTWQISWICLLSYIWYEHLRYGCVDPLGEAIMTLASVVHRIATDIDFAHQIQSNPSVAFDSVGVELTQEECAALLAVLGSKSDWMGLCLQSDLSKGQFEWHILTPIH